MKKTKTPKNLEEAIEIIVELQQENAKLKELLGLNSNNSSLPPSQDRAKKKLNANLVGVSLAGSLAIEASQENYSLNHK